MNWLRIAGVEESLSARRAWIEMSYTIVYVKEQGVALRKESVDRNPYLTKYHFTGIVALRKESVDRNANPMLNA